MKPDKLIHIWLVAAVGYKHSCPRVQKDPGGGIRSIRSILSLMYEAIVGHQNLQKLTPLIHKNPYLKLGLSQQKKATFRVWHQGLWKVLPSAEANKEKK